jgi:hypothetical protein
MATRWTRRGFMLFGTLRTLTFDARQQRIHAAVLLVRCRRGIEKMVRSTLAAARLESWLRSRRFSASIFRKCDGALGRIFDDFVDQAPLQRCCRPDGIAGYDHLDAEFGPDCTWQALHSAGVCICRPDVVEDAAADGRARVFTGERRL